MSLLLVSSICFAGSYYSPLDMFKNNQWKVFNSLLESDKDKDIVIYWEGIGGYVSNLFHFRDTVNKLKSENKKITFNLVGYSASTHATAVCLADKVIWNRNILMFHRIENGKTIKNPVADWISKENKEMLDVCVKKGILTKDEELLAMTNKEVYVGYNKQGIRKSLIKEDKRK